MAYKYAGRKLTQDEILEVFRQGFYYVDGKHIRRRNGTIVKCYEADDDGHRYVRIYWNTYGANIAVHKLVWMVCNNSTIPLGWEIHHRDRNTINNHYENLFCLHPNDHRKLHKSDLIAEDDSFDIETF